MLPVQQQQQQQQETVWQALWRVGAKCTAVKQAEGGEWVFHQTR